MSGGARVHSGPRPDPLSARSDRRGLSFRLLAAAGYTGAVPGFPLPDATQRELALWEQVWRTPQAIVWAEQEWRHPLVGQFVRWSVRAEQRDCGAAVLAGVLRMNDQLGLSPAGLKENGWVIAHDVAEVVSPTVAAARTRLRAVTEDTPPPRRMRPAPLDRARIRAEEPRDDDGSAS